MSDNEKDFVPNGDTPVNSSAETSAESNNYSEPTETAHQPETESSYSPYSQQQYSQQGYTQPNYQQTYYNRQSYSAPNYNYPPNYGYTQPNYQQPPYTQPNSYVDPLPEDENNTEASAESIEFESDGTAKKIKKNAGKKKSKGFIAFLITAVVIVALVIGVMVAYSYQTSVSPEEEAQADGTQLIISETPSITDDSESLSTIQIAENAEKINVGILIYGKAQSFMSGGTNSLLGEGSGIVMGEDESGKYTYILTCAHVISDANNSSYTITVQDADGNSYDGVMVGYDVKTDIGVIKIAKTGLTTAVFGDSSALKKGQKVYAIGNPGGTEFFGSFSDGMVSSIDRPISSESGYEMKCIQHTTAINSGNSGGALLNEFGQVIGINSSKIVSEGYEGMAFAIPISDAKPIIDDIIANGYVTNRPKLGITYSAAMDYSQYAVVVKINDLPAGSLILREITSDSSLANTEAQPYDIITKVNGEDLDTADVLLGKIENGSVGDELTLTLCRVNDDYSVKEFTVKAALVADTGNTASSSQESSTQNYWEEYFNNGF